MSVSTPPAAPSTTVGGAAASPAARRPTKRRRRYSLLTRRDKLVLFLMVAVPAFIHIFLIWLPTIGSIVLSFTDWNGVGGLDKIRFVGLKNYDTLVNIYPPFWSAFSHNLIWLATFLFIATPFGMLLAVVLDQNIRGSRIYQSALYMPVVLSLAIVGFIWELIYSPGQGFINNALAGLTGDPSFVRSGSAIDWLGNRNINLWAVLVAAGWRHVGYIMVLYLAGLKSVDNTLREAAAIDGANARQTFFRVVFPVLTPINVVVLVMTVIESLRAFDIMYVINKGLNGLELLSVLVTNNILGEASLVGFGSAIAVILLLISIGPIIWYLARVMRESRHDGADPPARRRRRRPAPPPTPPVRHPRVPHRVAVLWIFPLAWTVYTAFRPYGETARLGYVSIGGTYNLDNFVTAWNQGDMLLHFYDTIVIVVPAMLLVLFFASMIAFAVTRYSFRFNLLMLMLFTAGNLLPQQIIILPLYHIYLALRCPSSSTSPGSGTTRTSGSSPSTSRSSSASARSCCQLHEAAAQGVQRGGVVDGARVAAVLDRHHAADPARARGPGDAGVHLDLQRLLLGPGPDADRRRAADHVAR